MAHAPRAVTFNLNPSIKMKHKLTDKQHLALLNATEEQLRDRVATLGLQSATGEYRRHEAAFLAGAMTVINHLFPAADARQLSERCPPRWVLAPLTGKSVLDMEPLKD